MKDRKRYQKSPLSFLYPPPGVHWALGPHQAREINDSSNRFKFSRESRADHMYRMQAAAQEEINMVT